MKWGFAPRGALAFRLPFPWKEGRSTTSRLTWHGASPIVLFNLVLAAWLLFKPGGHALLTAVDDVAQFAGPLTVSIWVFVRSVRYAVQTQYSHARWFRRSAPAFLGLGVFGFALGQMIFTIYEQVLHIYAPFPSLSDAAFLLAYPCLLIGIMGLPTDRSSFVSNTRIVLDGLMTMTALVTFSWYFILGPTILHGSGSLLAKAVGAAYPFGDLVLIVCLLILARRSTDIALRRVVHVLALALSVIVITDSVYDYQTLHNTYATGSLADIGWPLGYMLVGLCALCLRPALLFRSKAHGVDCNQRRWSLPGMAEDWQSLLPYALIPLVGGLATYALTASTDKDLAPGVCFGGASLVVLVLIRQIFAIRENTELNRSLAEVNRRLETLATTDPLTDLPNHRALMAALDQELERAQRYQRPCSVLVLDLDHFKALNDGLGHPAGDVILREMGSVARATLRGIDILARWGGEEFVAILPETGDNEAVGVAERVRAAVAQHLFGAGGGVRVTCSLGVATYPHHARDRDELVKMADQAMYAAKRLGRNQVRSLSDPAVSALSAEMAAVGSRDAVALTGTVEALAALVDARDAYTGQHAHDVSTLSVRLALALGLDTSETHLLALAARLHDVGKVVVPDAVLRKPGRLNADEWALIRQHPAVGADVVSRVPALRALAPIIRAHHERFDGGGYPDGLAGDAIPSGARIIAVADAFNAMTTDRPYRKAATVPAALEELRRCGGAQFDVSIVDALERVLAVDTKMRELSEAS